MTGAPAEGLVLLLAFVGGAALLYRLLGGLFRLALRASQETAARSMAESSARRGDVSGMVERQRAAEAARRDRRVHMAVTLLWMTWFTIPLMLGSARIPFAVASVLWLLPTSRSTRPTG
jgi:hypothetical protein